MRKRLISPESHDSKANAARSGWLDLGEPCQAEITSEDAARPIESALLDGAGGGWRASGPGRQLIRLLFDEPQTVRRVRLEFDEGEQERTQEFALRWSADGGRSYREVVRQQYTFSPPVTTSEAEDYRVELEGATILELEIVPHISGDEAWALLARFRVE